MNVRHRFLFGVHVSKDPEGIEGNVQIALGTIRKKKYERVANRRNNSQASDEQIEDNLQAPVQQIEDNLQTPAEQIEGNG